MSIEKHSPSVLFASDFGNLLENALTTPLTCATVKFKAPASAVILFFCAVLSVPAAVTYSSANIAPPWISREFRAVWVATVANIDWPSKPGLPVDEQKKELLAILDHAVKANLNAVVFQVRPVCDAFYDSRLEPWSYYLTGVMGKAPSPYYDPLQFVVEESHKRGLELHAWFNPYRAGHPSWKPPVAANHISKTRPDLVRKYDTYLWLDPGLREVQEYSLEVIMDVVRRYDIDGIHIDDYFYPYPTKDARNREMDFPDGAAWKIYTAAGGKLSREDWRRESINTFVHELYDSVKASKPWVKVGISPFGIWQPGSPKPIEGFNAYAKLYADSRKWLASGWLDYCSPQLYWPIQETNHSFPVLLKWWSEQNVNHRGLWPGLNIGKVGGLGGWKAAEIVNQIKATREQCGSAAGEIFWGVKALTEDHGGLAATLANGVFAKPALIPSTPWLEKTFPARPVLRVENGKAHWESEAGAVSRWVLQIQTDGQWQTQILSGDTRSHSLPGSPEVVALTAIDRCGVASPAAVVQKDANPSQSRQ
jgi:uncharacterized lipoprotein YddW (UPF0748 family)